MPVLRSVRHVFWVAVDAVVACFLLAVAAFHGRRPAGASPRRVTFLIEGDPKTGLSPAARYRAMQYVPLLEQRGISCTVRPSRPSKYFASSARFQRAYRRWRWLVLPYAALQHARQVVHRLLDFAGCAGNGVVFLQRDLAGTTRSRLEEYLRLCNRRIVFDFDDAIYARPTWLADREPPEVAGEMRAKIARICSLSSIVVAANPLLAEFARRWCARVHVIPTCLDTDEFRPPTDPPDNPVAVLGWVGTSGNLIYLREIVPALRELAGRREFVVRVVCNRVEPTELPELPAEVLEFVEWSADGEVERIQQFDVGLMPLADDEWTRGKAGFKLVQYMACGVPVVASRVGANPAVVGDDGECGYLVDDLDGWVSRLDQLLGDPALRRNIGEAGRRRVVSRFDLRVHVDQLAEVLAQAAAG